MNNPAPTTGGPPRPPRPPKTPEHWNALASVVAAAVSALTFLVGFIGLPAAGVHSPAATPETVTATTTVTATATREAPEPNESSDEQPSASASIGERWSGSLLYEPDNDYDLDLTPPRKEGDQTDALFESITEGRDAVFSSGSMALVHQGDEMNAADCIFLVQTQSKASISVPVGGSFCVTTTASRAAIVTVRKLDTTDGTVTVDVRVWDKAP
ncbi:hypothetical protein [Streptomyces sp. NPDC048436]|uniref:hypothetical protein n=1 Tax=Streptomyces sp. NPDC048436 TaxID=3365550 RepID=UPI0037231613